MKHIPLRFAVAALCATSPLAAQDETEQKLSADEVATVTEDVESRLDEYTSPNYFNPNGPRISNRRDVWFRQADYPPQSWLEGEEGRVAYAIAVEADGTASGCDITQSSGFPALDEVTCAVLLERATFEPARNAEGEAIAATYRGRYSWRKREPEVPGSFRMRVSFVLDETGRTSDCVVEELEGELPRDMRKSLDSRPCPFGRRLATAPHRDENGVPVAKRMTVTFAAEVQDLEGARERILVTGPRID